MKLSKKHLILFIIFLIAFSVRFYKLGEIPSGLSQDETSLGYNAYSILTTGNDEYGKPFPITFKAFGEYKLPGYIYLSVPSVAIFGNTPLGIRFPSAVFGFITVILSYFFVRKLTGNENLSLLATLLFALNPWHIHFSRAAFEVVPALFFIILGSYLLHVFLNTKRFIYLVLSGSFFIISMYTYNTCRVLAPLLFIIHLYLYRSKIDFGNKKLWLSGIPLVLLLTPFLMTFLGEQGIGSAQGTLLHASAPIQAKILEERSAIFTQNPFVAKLFFNKFILTFFEYVRNIFSYFSVPFLFINGSEHPNHGIGRMGMFYIFEAITLIYGIFLYSKKLTGWMKLLVLWAVAAILVAAFTREAPHGTRGFFLIPPLVITSAYGMYQLCITMLRNRSLFRIPIILSGTAFIAFNLIYYFSSYYLRFPISNGLGWRSQDAKLVEYLKINENKYDRIILDTDSSFMYTSLLYYLPYSPSKFQKEVIREADDSEGFSKVISFGKYKYEKVERNKTFDKKTLIITTPKNIQDNYNIVQIYYYPERPVVIAKGQEILQFPTRDIAYVVAEIK